MAKIRLKLSLYLLQKKKRLKFNNDLRLIVCCVNDNYNTLQNFFCFVLILVSNGG